MRIKNRYCLHLFSVIIIIIVKIDSMMRIIVVVRVH